MTPSLSLPPARHATAVTPPFALWALGFRPFYLLASAFASLSIGLWAMQFAGWMPYAYLRGPLWHAHEMLFGFALAVIVGFLFTAGRNWSGQPTPTGAGLAMLATLWLVARVLVLTPYGCAAAAANVAFPLACAIGLGLALVKGRNRRNYFFPGLLVLLSGCALVFHLAALGMLRLDGARAIQMALDIVLLIVVVVTGRVVPMFTNNGIPHARARNRPVLERIALTTVVAITVCDLVGVPPVLFIALATAATVAHAARICFWQPWKTSGHPLVWVLHLACAWVPVHLGLRAMATFGLVASSLPVHALTIGVVGGLIIGMMVRTARGHTARVLRADAWDTLCFALIALSAATRVVVPLAVPSLLIVAVLASALLWSLGFGLYTVRYWPVLSRARCDGRPG